MVVIIMEKKIETIHLRPLYMVGSYILGNVEAELMIAYVSL